MKHRRYGPGSSHRTDASNYNPDPSEQPFRDRAWGGWMRGELEVQRQVTAKILRRREQQARRPWGG